MKLLILAVLTSAAASTQTTILPTARTTLSMAAVKALPKSFSTVSPRYQTPTVSTWAMGLVSIAFYAGLTFFNEAALSDLILSIGLLIAFYYGITGFASAWYFRRELFRSASAFFMKGLFPLLGGVILFAAMVQRRHRLLRPGVRLHHLLQPRWCLRTRCRVDGPGRGAHDRVEHRRAAVLRRLDAA